MVSSYSLPFRGWHERSTWIVRAVSAIATQVRRALCGLRGHEMRLHTEASRVCLQCAYCGAQSHGWATAAPRLPGVRPLRAHRVK
jgi:hypothetical protein